MKHYKKTIGVTTIDISTDHTPQSNVSRETLTTTQKHKTTPSTTQQTQANKTTIQYIKQITRTNVSRETLTTAFLTKAQVK